MCNGLILKYLLISQLNEETVSRMIPAESVNSVALCHQSIACVSCLSRPTQHHRHNQHNFGAGLPVCWVGGSGYLYGNSPYLLFSLAVHSLNTSCSFHYLCLSIIAHDSSTQLIFHLLLQIPQVSCDEADTYKCYATNEYGKAVCPVILNVIEGRAHTS